MNCGLTQGVFIVQICIRKKLYKRVVINLEVGFPVLKFLLNEEYINW